MEKHLITFEEIKAKANALKKLTPYRIKIMDIEIFINLYCAYAKWIGDNLACFSEKYNYDMYHGFSLENRIRNGSCDGTMVRINFKTLFWYGEIGIKELLLHELAHTKYNNHEVEFWNQLVFTLNEENLLFNNRIHVFETKTTINGERVLLNNGRYFGLYYKNCHNMAMCNRVTMDRCKCENVQTVSAIVGKVLHGGRRRWLDMSVLCENGKHMPLWSTWERYMECYGLLDRKLKFRDFRGWSIFNHPWKPLPQNI